MLFSVLIKRIQKIIPRSFWLRILLVFVLFFSLFLLTQAFKEGFYCVDGFYHMKRAYLLRTEHFLGSMPWMQYTVFRDRSLDIALLFWVVLIPFTLGNLFWGAKLAVAFFAGLFFALFYWVLKKWQIKQKWLWMILLFLVSPAFLTMLNMARPHILAVSLFLLTIYLANGRKYLPLFCLTIFYTLAYEAFFISIFVSLIFVFSEIIFAKKFNWKLTLASLGGVVGGLSLHPYPRDYLYNINNALFRVPYYRFSGKLALGAGLYGSPADAFLQSLPLFLVLAVTLGIFLPQAKRFKALSVPKKIQIGGLFLLFLFALLINSAAGMLVYYLVPVGILLCAVMMQEYYSPQVERAVQRLFLKEKLLRRLALGLLAFWLCIFLIIAVRGTLLPDHSSHYKEGALWLAENTPSQSTVFQSNWDAFPALFFFNTHNYYLLGLDPPLMYQYDANLFWRWQNLVLCGMLTAHSKACRALLTDNQDFRRFQQISTLAEIHDFIRNDLNSQFIFADNEYKKFIARLKEDPQLFQERYADQYVTIFELK